MVAGEGDNCPNAVESRIIKQIEFYFGDHNLPKDRFLQQKIVENEDGWVPLSILMTFNRLKVLADDTDIIVKALKKSANDVIEVSEDNQSIRRSTSNPIPVMTEDKRVDVKKRTVYVKGFPSDLKLEELESFIQGFGQVNYIRMRRYQDKTFKGSIFTEFCKQEDAAKFVTTEGMQFQNHELLKMLQKDYYDKKRQEKAERKLANKSATTKQAKESGEEDQNEQDEEEEKEDALDYDKGCVLHFKNVGEQTSREDLKELFGPFEEIGFVDFSRNDTEGYIRFTNGGGAARATEKVKEKNDGTIVIRDVESVVRILEGEEEKQYWIKCVAERAKLKEKRRKKKGGGNRKRNFKGNKKFSKGVGKRSRPNDADDDVEEPHAKAAKND